MILFDKRIVVLVFCSFLFNSYLVCSESVDQIPGNISDTNSDNSSKPSNVSENLGNRDIFDNFENYGNVDDLDNSDNSDNFDNFDNFENLGDFEELNSLDNFGELDDDLGNPGNPVQTTGNLKVEIIGDQAFHLGEGPFWDERQSVLWHIDTFKGWVCRLDVKRRVTTKLNLKDYISVVIPIEKRENKFIVSRRNELIEFDWNLNSYKVIDNVKFEKFNDGKVDAKGRLWIGTLRNTVWESNENTIRNAGALYRLDGRKLTRIVTMSLPNGMDWSLDNKNFYIADTIERQIYVYDFNLTDGSIRENRNKCFQFLFLLIVFQVTNEFFWTSITTKTLNLKNFPMVWL